MIFSPADHRHLLILPLPHVPYPAIARESIEGKAPGLPQACGKDLPAQVWVLTARMRIVRGDPIGHPRLRMIHIQAVHLPQPAAQILGVTLRVFLRPPIPHGKVEHAVRAKGERPAIVVVCRLCHRTKFSGRLPRIPQAILTGPVFPKDSPPLLLPQGLMFEEVASVGGKLRMKGQTHQAFPRSVTDGSTEVAKKALVGRGLIGEIQTPGLATTVLQYHPLALMPGDGRHPHGAIPQQALR